MRLFFWEKTKTEKETNPVPEAITPDEAVKLSMEEAERSKRWRRRAEISHLNHVLSHHTTGLQVNIAVHNEFVDDMRNVYDAKGWKTEVVGKHSDTYTNVRFYPEGVVW